ncbi:MAG: thioredoxin family protein [Planctomycetaceae bacterium]|nr:thioredoxin family protein [Planctomycetaceae bacterium]
MTRTQRWIRTAIFLVVGLAALFSAASLSAAKFNKVLDIGKPAPAWKELLGVDGQRHGLDDLKEAKLVVVVFACNHCPVVKAYERRLIRFVDDYRDKGVEFVAISVSRQPSDQLPQMKTRASDSGFNFPYLIDPTQKIARAYGATCTPHVFVLDQKRRVAYMGKIDDHLDDSKVGERFLRDAVDALLAGKQPEVAETRQVGCDIEFVE